MDKRGLKTSLVVSIVVMCILCIYLIFYITSQYEHNTNQNDNKSVENSNSADVLLLERYVDAFKVGTPLLIHVNGKGTKYSVLSLIDFVI